MNVKCTDRGPLTITITIQNFPHLHVFDLTIIQCTSTCLHVLLKKSYLYMDISSSKLVINSYKDTFNKNLFDYIM